MQYYFKQFFGLHSSGIIFSFLIKRSRQKAIEIEIAFFHPLGNPKGRTLDHFFNASHIRHNFPYKLILYQWVSLNISEVINENSTSAFNYLDDFSCSQKIYDLFLLFCTIMAFLKIGILQIVRRVLGCKSGEKSGEFGFGYLIKTQKLLSHVLFQQGRIQGLGKGVGCWHKSSENVSTSVFLYLDIWWSFKREGATAASP